MRKIGRRRLETARVLSVITDAELHLALDPEALGRAAVERNTRRLGAQRGRATGRWVFMRPIGPLTHVQESWDFLGSSTTFRTTQVWELAFIGRRRR